MERTRKEKRRRSAVRTTPTTDTLFHPTAASAAVASAAEPPVVVESIATLFRDFPHVREALPPPAQQAAASGSGGGGKRAGGAAAAAAAATAAAPHPRHPQHRENPEAKPYLVEEFQFLLSRLPLPSFTLLPLGPAGPALTDQQQLWAALKETREDRRLLLPLMRSSHESRLLAEAGTFPCPQQRGRQVTYPACQWGAACVARTQRLHGFTPERPGVTLMALLFEEEYETLLQSGRCSVKQRPCVLCYRFHAQDYVLTLQPNFQRVGGVDEGVVQIYRNLCDQPQGYFREAMLHPNPTRFEGFVDPIALFLRSSLRAYRDPQQGGRWVIDQSSICVPDHVSLADAAVPPVGQPLGDF